MWTRIALLLLAASPALSMPQQSQLQQRRQEIQERLRQQVREQMQHHHHHHQQQQQQQAAARRNDGGACDNLFPDGFYLDIGSEVSQDAFCKHIEETPFQLTEGMQRYALNTYELLTRKSRGNVIFSPFSLHTALSMTYFGSPADSRTHREMGRALGMENQSLQGDYAVNYLKMLLRYDNLRRMLDTTVEFANRMFLAKDFSPKPDYKLLMRTYYLTDLTSIDFRDSVSAARSINDWVSSKTHGLIRDLVQPSNVNGATRLVIVNAIYFKANWKYQFEPRNTRTRPFNVGEARSNHRSMQQTGNFYLAELPELGARALELPYEDEDFRMLVILPDEDGEEPLHRLDAALPSLDMASLDRRLQPARVDVQMPKFKADAQAEMTNILMQMGVKSIFDQTADLTDISDERLSVSAVLHKATVEVSEEGTEAAAATAVAIGIRTVSARPIVERFHIDRPFVFIVEDRLLGVPLFMGRIVDPTGRERLRTERRGGRGGEGHGDEEQLEEIQEVFGERQKEPEEEEEEEESEDFLDEVLRTEQQQQQEEEEEDDGGPDCDDRDEDGYSAVNDPDAVSFPCRGRDTMVLEAAQEEQRRIVEERRQRAARILRDRDFGGR